MTRFAVFLMLGCAFLGAMFYLWSWNNDIQAKSKVLDRFELEWKEQDTKDLCDVVYSTRDVAKGAVIDAKALEIRRFSRSKIPEHALVNVHVAIGRRAAYGLVKGQMVTLFDLNPYHLLTIDKTTSR